MREKRPGVTPHFVSLTGDVSRLLGLETVATVTYFPGTCEEEPKLLRLTDKEVLAVRRLDSAGFTRGRRLGRKRGKGQ